MVERSVPLKLLAPGIRLASPADILCPETSGAATRRAARTFALDATLGAWSPPRVPTRRNVLPLQG